jgi:hypothetical protein
MTNNDLFWVIENLLLCVAIPLFAFLQINSYLFIAVPRAVRYLWFAVIAYSSIIILDSTFAMTEVNRSVFTADLADYLNLKVPTFRTSGMALWIVVYVIISLCYQHRAEAKHCEEQEKILIKKLKCEDSCR